MDYVNRDDGVKPRRPGGLTAGRALDVVIYAVGAVCCGLVAWGVLLVRRRLRR